jgi:galactokinase
MRDRRKPEKNGLRAMNDHETARPPNTDSPGDFGYNPTRMSQPAPEIELAARFQKRYGVPARVFRAPGRVNLIGEHVDYNGFGVLPMAIDRGIAAAWRPRGDGRVVLRSLEGYEPREFSVEPPIAPYGPGDWGNYVKAAAQGLLDSRLPLRGAEILVSATLPPSAGLSSSSALVVLSALVLLEASGLAMPRLALAALLAEAEKYVGTQGGGMDQAASLLGLAGHALRIDFGPLRAEPLPWFTDCVVVVANSLVRASKAEAAGYNTRAAECRLAAAHAARRLGRRADPPPLLADLLAVAGREEILAALPPGPVSLQGAGVPEPPGGFQLLRRARHVLSEAARVDAACAALRAGDAAAFGRLMDDSHASCRDDYEISCPALDRLVGLARDAGAVGARLTGAGFGGCVISLVALPSAVEFRRRLAEAYQQATGRAPEIWVCRPAAGVEVISLKSEV